MSFVRKKENFTCEHCKVLVEGNGFTNHCPQCLYSKHVDITPGDRAATCGGLMPPVAALPNREEYIILHRCSLCGYKKKNKSSSFDNSELLISLTAQPFSDIEKG